MTDESLTTLGTAVLAAGGAAASLSTVFVAGGHSIMVELLIGAAGALFGAGVAWQAVRSAIEHLTQRLDGLERSRAEETRDLWQQINELKRDARDHLERLHAR